MVRQRGSTRLACRLLACSFLSRAAWACACALRVGARLPNYTTQIFQGNGGAVLAYTEAAL